MFAAATGRPCAELRASKGRGSYKKSAGNATSDQLLTRLFNQYGSNDGMAGAAGTFACVCLCSAHVEKKIKYASRDDRGDRKIDSCNPRAAGDAGR